MRVTAPEISGPAGRLAGPGRVTAPGPPGTSDRVTARGRAGVIAAAAVLVIGVIAVVTVVRRPASPSGPRLRGALAAAEVAGFTAARFAASTQPAYPALSAIAAAGSTVVAVGSQLGQPAARTRILVSADGGLTWSLASLRTPGGGLAAGAVPDMVAGGQGTWLALGPGGGWTSAAGRTWTLAPGVAPLAAGDRVLALARTAAGFVAVGEQAPAAGGTGSPVLWTSADGRTWQRQRPALPAAHAHVRSLSQVVSDGSVTMVAGTISRISVRRHGKRVVRVVSVSDALWRTADGGVTWTAVAVPVSHGATGRVAGLAATAAGFVAIRPGRLASRPASHGAGRADAVTYTSATGSAWSFAGTLAARKGGLSLRSVGGNGSGIAAIAVSGPAKLAFTSANGRSWHGPVTLGRVRSLSGVTATPDGGLIAAGAGYQQAAGPGTSGHGGRPAPAAPAQPEPFLLRAGTGTQAGTGTKPGAPGQAGKPAAGRASLVGQAALAAAASPGDVVDSVATAAGRQVAVGAAGASPAIWSAPAGGSWSRAAVSILALPGIPALTSVAHGSVGWLAVGPGSGGASARPAMVTSADGIAWQPGDGSLAFGPGTSLTQAAAGPSGYVAVGSELVQGRPAAAAWFSPGLTTWQQGGDIGGTPGGNGTSSQMLSVTAVPSGFIAAGFVSAGAAARPAVWTSADGRAWQLTSLPEPSGTTAALIQRIAASGPRVVALGTTVTGAGTGGGTSMGVFAAVSADGGRTWREVRLPASRGASVTALTPAPGGFVAAGGYGPAGRRDAILWSSVNGMAWTALRPTGRGLSGPGDQQVTALSVAGGWLTGVGYSATGADSNLAAWRIRLG